MKDESVKVHHRKEFKGPFFFFFFFNNFPPSPYFGKFSFCVFIQKRKDTQYIYVNIKLFK